MNNLAYIRKIELVSKEMYDFIMRLYNKRDSEMNFDKKSTRFFIEWFNTRFTLLFDINFSNNYVKIIFHDASEALFKTYSLEDIKKIESIILE